MKQRMDEPAAWTRSSGSAVRPDIAGCTQRRLHATRTRWLRVPLADEAAAETDTLFLPGTQAFAHPGKRFPSPSASPSIPGRA